MPGCDNCGSATADEDGLCKGCRIERDEGPEARKRYYRELGRKGGYASGTGRGGLDRDELPPLDSHDAAETWCDAVGRAVVVGRIGHNEAKAALRAVREWRESRDQGAMSERLDALTDALAEWKRTGDPSPVLEVID